MLKTELHEPLLALDSVAVDVKTEGEPLRLIDDVSFTVNRGETVGLVGESGSGKTVTSLAIMRLLPAGSTTSGSIRLNGQELTGLSTKQLNQLRGSKMAMVFQEPRRSLNSVFTVGDQVAEAVRKNAGMSRKNARARVVELFDLVQIPDARRRIRQYPHEFSGGMCQRVMLAMALAGSPELLIADEPTTALDVTVQRQVLGLIDDLQRSLGLGVLLITHDLGLVAEVCERSIVMYAGRPVEEAPVLDLFDRPQHPYTAGLLNAIPDPLKSRSRLGAIPGTVPSARAFVDSCRFAPRCPAQQHECTDNFVSLEETTPQRKVRCVRSHEVNVEEMFRA
ncbi:ABC transporter ATP-binding protein [Rhodococcus sp. NPDC127530]|uniref:ABC transporter ATP-binding protein n=1 Tax=unclassified Rhodococcus (in: high G+C Gram-positive bacteria) TaxID=192944 RepID=UPI00363C5FF4